MCVLMMVANVSQLRTVLMENVNVEMVFYTMAILVKVGWLANSFYELPLVVTCPKEVVLATWPQ